jgi:hypothetical protein
MLPKQPRGTKMKRPIIEDELEDMVQRFANHTTDGNFTEAVSILIRSALLANKILEHKQG